MTRRNRTTLNRLTELLLVAVGFGAVYGVWLAFFNRELSPLVTLATGGVSVVGFWIAAIIKDDPDEPGAFGIVLLELCCFGAGVGLLVHALITYGFLTRRTPFLVTGGSLAAALLVSSWRKAQDTRSQRSSRVLVVGFDSLCARVVDALGDPLVGIWAADGLRDLPDAPVFSVDETLQSVVEKTNPTMILLGRKDWESVVSPQDLLNYRMAGIRIVDCPHLYEKLFLRVCCDRLQPVDLALSSSLRGDSRTMAIQAIYNNFLGLAMLLVFLPLMLLISIAILLTSGKGPAIESIECAGFQRIPFRLQRFRTTREDGSRTAVGQLLRRLRIVNLPQLFNVVRGDMALVGPRPVRSEFARRLTTQMPYFAHRFAVKPGFGGWAQLHLPGRADRDTRTEIEYDLYYIKEGSVWLDLEILIERLFGGVRPAGKV